MTVIAGQPGRIDNFAERPGECAAACRDLGWRSAVAAPVVVAGRTWGMAIVASKRAPPLPPDTEARVSEFTDLVATAIANAESRAELAASRARIVVTADATRRRIERDLHDGAQQRLVSVVLELRGVGGADLALGSGLLGLKDRAEAIGGMMSLQSAPGEGTSLHVELPIDDQG
jgi:signal transduction histidine kinase